MDARERRAQAERLKNRLFRRMLARGFPASVVRDLLEIS
jgi:SOS response regulatory protein OraA/RecX